MSEVVSLEDYRLAARPGARHRRGGSDIFFDRRELRQILDLYAVMVAGGEWRDYAIAHDRTGCSFSVFRRSCEGALYQIVKRPVPKRAAYAVRAGGQVLRQGQTLAAALQIFAQDKAI
jgi:hypothetical protein